MITEKEAWNRLADDLQVFHKHKFPHPYVACYDLLLVFHYPESRKTFKYDMSAGLCPQIAHLFYESLITKEVHEIMLYKIAQDVSNRSNSFLFPPDFGGLLQRIIYCKQKASQI